MNNIIEWFKNLPFEIIVILVFLLILLILVIWVLFKSNRIYNAISKKTLEAKEDLLLENGVYLARINTTNIGFTNTIVKESGFVYKKTKLPIDTEQFNLTARSFKTTVITIEELRDFIISDNNKINKFYFYIIDSINRITKIKMKLAFKHIKNIIAEENRQAKAALKAEKKARRIANKQARIETGEYNFGDRVVLILAAIFSPLVKLSQAISKKINKQLRKREIKKEVRNELMKEKAEEKRLKILQSEEEYREKYSSEISEKMDRKSLKKQKRKSEKINEDQDEQKKFNDENSNVNDNESEINIDNDDEVLDENPKNNDVISEDESKDLDDNPSKVADNEPVKSIKKEDNSKKSSKTKAKN